MAIEDAAALEHLLSKMDFPRALSIFEESRLRRKIKVQQLSLHNLHLYHLEDV